jgi:polyhydroxyalkanoate synthesis regulator phasin
MLHFHLYNKVCLVISGFTMVCSLTPGALSDARENHKEVEMSPRRLILALVALCLVSAAVLAESPRPVSPGDSGLPVLIEQRCPTFSWAGAAGAKAYELLVFGLEGGDENVVQATTVETANPLVQVVVPGAASSWTPDRSQCLQPGSRYAWSIRAVGGEEVEPWSEVQIFEVAALPQATALQRVLRKVVDEMVEAGDLNAAEAEAVRYLMSPGATLSPDMDRRVGEHQQVSENLPQDEPLSEKSEDPKSDDIAGDPLAPVAVAYDSALSQDLRLAYSGNQTIWADASDAQITFYQTDGSLAMAIDGSFAGTGGGWIDGWAADLGGSGVLHTLRVDSQGYGSSGEILLYGQPTAGGTSTRTVELRATEAADDGASLRLFKMDGTEAINLDAEWGGAGGDSRIWTQELQITGGSDLCEHFEVNGVVEPEPGMVVTIAGTSLEISRHAYSRAVAGVISGAGGLKPGLYMGQANTEADGQYPVALSGRVYVWADASSGAIHPGDLLTTSDVPGHAMGVVDYEQSHGAILGKAMSTLEEGRGLVLALVSLQ